MKICNSEHINSPRNARVIILEEQDFDDWDSVIRNTRFNRCDFLFTPRDLTEEQIRDLSPAIAMGDILFAKLCKYGDIKRESN